MKVPYVNTDGLNAEARRALKRKQAKGGGKGDGKVKKAAKGDGKGKNSFKPSGDKTRDGMLVCDYFQSASGCTNSNCKFLHVCSACYKPHGFSSGLC